MDPVSDGAWFWENCHDRLRDTLSRKVAPLRVRRDSFARAMVASEKEYRRCAKEGGVSASPPEIIGRGFRELGLRVRDEDISATMESYARVAGGLAAAFPDAYETLVLLRSAGYRLGLLSNTWWASEWLDADLRSASLAELFDEVLYSSDLSHTKPHPAVFLEVSSRLGVEAERCIMVGDDPLCDVGGAMRVGMRSIWKRNGQTHRDLGDVEPTAIVDRLAEVPEVLSSLKE